MKIILSFRHAHLSKSHVVYLCCFYCERMSRPEVRSLLWCVASVQWGVGERLSASVGGSAHCPVLPWLSVNAGDACHLSSEAQSLRSKSSVVNRGIDGTTSAKHFVADCLSFILGLIWSSRFTSPPQVDQWRWVFVANHPVLPSLLTGACTVWNRSFYLRPVEFAFGNLLNMPVCFTLGWGLHLGFKGGGAAQMVSCFKTLCCK